MILYKESQTNNALSILSLCYYLSTIISLCPYKYVQKMVVPRSLIHSLNTFYYHLYPLYMIKASRFIKKNLFLSFSVIYSVSNARVFEKINNSNCMNISNYLSSNKCFFRQMYMIVMSSLC